MATHRFSRMAKIVTGAGTGDGEKPLYATELTRLERFAHFWALVAQGFIENRCLVRASALSFSSLLALIPMLAVAIGVTSSLLKSEGETQIYQVINRLVATLMPPDLENGGNPAATNAAPVSLAEAATNAPPLATTNVFFTGATNAAAATNLTLAALAEADGARMISAQKEAARNIHEFVQKTQSAKLGIVGMLLLVWVAISMLTNIEATFNDIWGVTRGRKWLWRIVLYWTTLTLGPLAMVGAVSLAGSSHLTTAHHLIGRMPLVGGLVFKVLPLVIIWLVFSLIYLTVPNTRVRFASALVGGLVAGSLWHLNNLLGYLYVSRVVTNNMIYGSLGLLPVFMAGLYFSWVILLFGVQVSYAFQNRRSCLQDKIAETVNQRGREFIALRLMTCLGLRYQNGQSPATAEQIALELCLPIRLTGQILQTLVTARLVTEVAGPEAAYCPARPLETINAHQVLLAVRSVNQPETFPDVEPVRDELYGEFARIEEAERVAAAAVSMLALVQRARAKLEPAPLAPATPVLALSEPAPPAATPEPPLTIELSIEPTAPEKLVGAVKSAAPAKPPRQIVVPEDHHDFPL